MKYVLGKSWADGREPDSVLQAIRAEERATGGWIAVSALDLQTGRRLQHQADRPVKTASVIKLPMLAHVAACVAEGSLDWEQPLTLTNAEKVEGSGILQLLTEGLTLTLRDVCTLMTVVSDNTATNMVIEALGKDGVNRRMRQLGLPVTTLFRKAFSPDTEESREYGLGVTTADEMVRLLSDIASNGIGGAAACGEIRRILTAQYYRDGIPRLLPQDWTYAGKTGGIDEARNDVGLVTLPDGRSFALAIFCQGLPEPLWTADNPGLLAIARLSRSLFCGLVE